MPDYNWDGTIVQGDYGRYIQFALYDEDDALYNLAGYSSIVAYFKRYGESTVSVSGTCTTLPVGTVRLLLASGDTDVAGEYEGEVSVYTALAITTWHNIHLTIKEKVKN